MTNGEQPNKPNWVEIATLWTLVISLICGGSFTAWRYVTHDRRLSSLEETLKIAQVREASEPVVEVHGHIISSNATVAVGREVLAVYPVVITISNSGNVPVEIDRIELQCFRGHISELVKREQQQGREESLMRPVKHTSSVSTETVNYGGVINLDSPNWRQLDAFQKTARLHACRIPRGQLRQHTFHLLLPSAPPNELHRVTVTVTPKMGESWDALTWSGFTNTAFCAPGPFPAGLENNDAPNPPANP